MTFKPFDKILEPDVRSTFQGSLLPGREWARMDVREHYDRVEEIRLPAHVDPGIAEMFDRARQAVLYAWYAYELSVLGEQYALGTLEAALRAHYRPIGRTTLDPLIRRAVADGIFPASVGGHDGRAPWLATLRNHWAHGANGFGGPLLACKTLRKCADLIGRLNTSPPPDTTAPSEADDAPAG
jgi:hypothetical protein